MTAAILTICGLALTGVALAQPIRIFDPAVVDRGKSLFSPNCGFCHGADARGGAGGPDLARSLVVLGDNNGLGIGDSLRAGLVDKGMPAFPGLTQLQISDIATFLHERVEAARRRVVSTETRVVVGDQQAGAAYFNGAGKCNTCHSVAGDLRGIGAKYDAVSLQDKFVNPRLSGSGADSQAGQMTVKVTPPSGETASGRLLYISEFAVTLRDSAGERRTYSRSGDTPKVEVTDPLRAHLDLMMKYTDNDIHNLTAYLVTIK